MGAPIVAADGTVYVGSKLGLHALDSDGKQKWLANLAYAEGAYVTIMKSGSLAVLTLDGGLHVIGTDGVELWSKPGPFDSFVPLIGNDGTIYVDAPVLANGSVQAFRQDGTLAWERAPSAKQFIGVAGIFPASGDVLLYAGPSDPGFVNAVLRVSPSGDDVWSWSPKGATDCDLIDGSDTVYCDGPGGVVGVTGKGQPTSSLPIGHPYILRHDGVFVSGTTNGLIATAHDGTKMWESPAGAAVLAVDGEDTLYAAGPAVVAIDKNGQTRWTFPHNSQDIALGRDHTLYVVSDGTLYALGP